ncbi:MAG: cation transporter [Bacteroidales bacterium]|jgi:copper chaperone CopZ|nr:cation transporter [Bacteroidales bacterium]
MKKKIVICLMAILCGLTVVAQKSDVKKTVIQTNGVCGMCKQRFMDNVPYFKGVTDVSYDMATAKLTVTYDAKKTTVDAICKGISQLGYDANDVKADPKVRAKLPPCCRADKSDHGTCKEGHGGQH